MRELLREGKNISVEHQSRLKRNCFRGVSLKLAAIAKWAIAAQKNASTHLDRPIKIFLWPRPSHNEECPGIPPNRYQAHESRFVKIGALKYTEDFP